MAGQFRAAPIGIRRIQLLKVRKVQFETKTKLAVLASSTALVFVFVKQTFGFKSFVQSQCEGCIS
jgi:hypothetical protein